MIDVNKIYCGDHLGIMNRLDDSSIDLVVTSPPYGSMRDYKGYVFDFENVAKSLYRVVKQGGVAVWVMKDQVVNGNKILDSFRQCLYFQSIGFNVYDVMIYSKASGSIPHANRYRDAFEYMFVFSKGKPKTVNLITDRQNKYGGTSTYGKITVREKNGLLTTRKKTDVAILGTRYNIWEYATGNGNTTSDKYAFKHPAMFPEKLAADHIKSWSNEGDLVLDPMCGSGTTLKMAKTLKRNFIGIDCSQEYCDIAQRRVDEVPTSLF